MRAARWVVIGTALVAAAIAFHMLMSPGGRSRSEARSREAASSKSPWAADRSAAEPHSGGAASAGPAGGSGVEGPGGAGEPPRGGPPLDVIDAESREAMRKFLRESAQDGNGK